jgi:hypothetical protein
MRDRLSPTPRWCETPSPSRVAHLGNSEDYNRLAVDVFPQLSEARDFNYKRGKALLAILCIQYGDIVNLETHLGDYMTLSMNDGFYDESRWPEGIFEPEIQERRRLVSMRIFNVADECTVLVNVYP